VFGDVNEFTSFDTPVDFAVAISAHYHTFAEFNFDLVPTIVP
jgi:hypothetical protein